MLRGDLRESKAEIEASELVLNPDKSIYHLKLLAKHIADTVLLVGDMGRVEVISNYFDKILFKIQNREFLTHTGILNGKKITVSSTGIGCDNIDIVINELDAAVNIDPETRKINTELRHLNFIRIGTSGALHENIPVDTFVTSSFGLGFDGLLNAYKFEYNEDERELINELNTQLDSPYQLYCAQASQELFSKISEGTFTGITATAHGFYGPQGRQLRLAPSWSSLNDDLANFKFKDQKITNFEMETSALYGLSSILGHNACTVCAIIANRVRKEYSKDYKKTVKILIEEILEKIN